MIEVIQIVPSLPPSVSGVGDYATLLAKELRRKYDIQTNFVVCDPAYDSSSKFAEFPATRVDARSSDRLQRALESIGEPGTPLLLHYVGYGYHFRGVPSWLLEGLESRRKKNNRSRMITMFHELYAFGPPWRSSFWTSPTQRYLVARLAKLSDLSVTNIRRSARYLELRTAATGRNVCVLPVFSNVEESEIRQATRENELVIFGGAAWREAAYNKFSADLLKVCSALKITKIHDIGSALSVTVKPPVEVEWHGVLPAARISEIMQRAQIGFFTYPIPFLAKSSIFAAYAAHGLVPLTTAGNDKNNEDQLKPEFHFLTSNSALDSVDRLEEIGKNVHRWYADHNLSIQAEKYATMIRDLSIGSFNASP